jgi:hypothetical protein
MDSHDNQVRVECIEEGGHWNAYLIDMGSHQRVGPTIRGTSEADAVARLERWAAWQRDHDAALRRLQQAVREYHRVETAGGLSALHEDMADDERRLKALERLDRARVDLDAVRRRRPS